MILDSIRCLNRYNSINHLFTEVTIFLSRPDIAELPNGRHEIDGDHVYAIVMRADGRSKEEAQLEIHNKYIDVQVVLDGVETMGWKARENCSAPIDNYDADKDFQFYKDSAETWVDVHAGQLAIFFPEDAHAPLVSAGFIHKVVVKVANQALA